MDKQDKMAISCVPIDDNERNKKRRIVTAFSD